jgi:uncharacterized protein YbaR (Trm112 family)
VDFLTSAAAAVSGARPSVWVGAGMLALASLLAATGAYAWARRRRVRLRGPQAAGPMICPACRRAYPLGTLFCPADATRLVAAAEGGAAAGSARGGRCPRCRRTFDSGSSEGMRFCPMDAEELVPMSVWQRDGDDAPADHLVGGQGKICPVCAGRYDLEAVFCGRDASELVTVN